MPLRKTKRHSKNVPLALLRHKIITNIEKQIVTRKRYTSTRSIFCFAIFDFMSQFHSTTFERNCQLIYQKKAHRFSAMSLLLSVIWNYSWSAFSSAGVSSAGASSVASSAFAPPFIFEKNSFIDSFLAAAFISFVITRAASILARIS